MCAKGGAGTPGSIDTTLYFGEIYSDLVSHD